MKILLTEENREWWKGNYCSCWKTALIFWWFLEISFFFESLIIQHVHVLRTKVISVSKKVRSVYSTAYKSVPIPVYNLKLHNQQWILGTSLNVSQNSIDIWSVRAACLFWNKLMKEMQHSAYEAMRVKASLQQPERGIDISLG